MNGAADMGGMHGFGPVEIEPNEPVFHADWEKKAFALNMAIGVANIWNLDAFRFARESLPPPQYLVVVADASRACIRRQPRFTDRAREIRS